MIREVLVEVLQLLLIMWDRICIIKGNTELDNTEFVAWNSLFLLEIDKQIEPIII